MGIIEKIIYYFAQYKFQVIYSSIFLSAVAFVGLFLVLRRSSLFGIVMSSSAQFSFVIGLALHVHSHGKAYSVLNTMKPDKVIADLMHMDLFILPIAFLVTFPLILLVSRGVLNAESLMASLFIFFMGLIPLANAIAGGSDLILLKVYFSEILYTQPSIFLHYLPYVLIALLLFVILLHKFLVTGFDATLVKIQGGSVEIINIVFFCLTGFIIALGVRVMGVYITMMGLIVPAMLALSLFQRLNRVIIATIAITLTLTVLGFVISFSFDKMPTEPTLIVFFGVASVLTWILVQIFKKIIQA